MQVAVDEELAFIELTPTHQYCSHFAGVHPIFEGFNRFIEVRCTLNVSLGDAGQLGAEFGDFGMQQGTNEQAEFRNNV